MGINFTPGGAQWSCMGFLRFRDRIGKEFGLELYKAFEMSLLNESTDEFVEIKALPSPMRDFFEMSDLEGIFDPELCKSIADVIEPIIGGWPSETGYEKHDKENGLLLVKGMRAAYEDDVFLEWS